MTIRNPATGTQAKLKLQNGAAWEDWYTGAATSKVFTAPQDGNYRFRVKGYDNIGNSNTTWTTGTFTVATGGPVITPVFPAEAGIINTALPTVRGQFSSPSAIDTTSLKLVLDGVTQSGATVTTSGFTLTLTSALNQGVHQVTAMVTNTVGLMGSKSWDFTVDTVSPTVSLTATLGVGREIAVFWLGSDATSGVNTYDVQYQVGASTTWTGWQTGTTALAATLQGTLAQSYTFRARATDKAGNVSNWVQSGPVTVSKVTKYYAFGAQKVAMRRGSVV